MKVEVTSWAPVPNKPTVSVDIKQYLIIIIVILIYYQIYFVQIT